MNACAESPACGRPDATPRGPRALRFIPGAAGLACALGIAASGLWSAAAQSDDAASAAAPAAAASASPAAAPGIWQSHRYSFQFMGFTSTYSCDGLADKLRVLLLAAGARADVKSQPGACAYPFGQPDKFARADLTFFTLAPLEAGAAPSDKPVNGAWRPVAFAINAPRELLVGDCELVEQFRAQVLPMFSTRNVTSNTTCVPYQASGSNIDLKLQAFAPITPIAAKKR